MTAFWCDTFHINSSRAITPRFHIAEHQPFTLSSTQYLQSKLSYLCTLQTIQLALKSFHVSTQKVIRTVAYLDQNMLLDIETWCMNLVWCCKKPHATKIKLREFMLGIDPSWKIVEHYYVHFKNDLCL